MMGNKDDHNDGRGWGVHLFVHTEVHSKRVYRPRLCCSCQTLIWGGPHIRKREIQNWPHFPEMIDEYWYHRWCYDFEGLKGNL